MIVGTSAGSITGTLLRLGVSPEDLAAWTVKAPLSGDADVLRQMTATSSAAAVPVPAPRAAASPAAAARPAPGAPGADPPAAVPAADGGHDAARAGGA